MGKRVKDVPVGERTIELRIRFWTNDIDGNPKGTITQRVCWDGGYVYVGNNKSHGIKNEGGSHFSGLCQLLCSVEKVLDKHDIRLQKGPRTPDVYRR